LEDVRKTLIISDLIALNLNSSFSVKICHFGLSKLLKIAIPENILISKDGL